MIPDFESAFDFHQPSEQLKTIASRLERDFGAGVEAELLPAEHGLRRSGTSTGYEVVVVVEGALRVSWGERRLLTFEEGECALIPGAPFEMQAPDFAVRVKRLRLEPSDALTLVEFFQSLWMQVAATVVRTPDTLLPRSSVFPPGEVIIEQGTHGTDVFTLMEGNADVLVDGVLVGEVKTDEFFGVLAAVTGTPRTASVVARTPCAVLVVPKENFRELIAARPVLVEKLIFELGRAIVDLNSRVVQMSRVSI